MRLPKATLRIIVYNDFFSPTRSDGSNIVDRVRRVSYNWSALAENLAGDYFAVQAAHDALIDFPGHRTNIMNPIYE